MINQVLRRRGWLVVRDGPFGEMLMPGESQAFAVADHQLVMPPKSTYIEPKLRSALCIYELK